MLPLKKFIANIDDLAKIKYSFLNKFIRIFDLNKDL